MTPQRSFGGTKVCGMTHTPKPSRGPRTALREARERRGLSQERLAYRAGLSFRTVYETERGRREPTAGTKRLLADALGVLVTEIFPERDRGRDPA